MWSFMSSMLCIVMFPIASVIEALCRLWQGETLEQFAVRACTAVGLPSHAGTGALLALHALFAALIGVQEAGTHFRVPGS